MPEQPIKFRSHPAKNTGGASEHGHANESVTMPPNAGFLHGQANGGLTMPPDAVAVSHEYAELAVTSNFTFLTGASHPDELVTQAAKLGYAAVAITDTNTLAGIVRAHVAAKEAGIQLIVGTRLTFLDAPGLDVLVYPTDLASYSRLCRLLTFGKRQAPKGQCHLQLQDLLKDNAGLLAVVVAPSEPTDEFCASLGAMKEAFDDDRLSLAASCLYGPDDRGRLDRIAQLARRTGIPLIATNDVHYHIPRRRALQDVLTCIKHGCTLAEAGLALLPNAERHLKEPAEMARLFAGHQSALARSVEIARRASGFSLEQLRYQYPHEVCPPGLAPIEHLANLAWAGAAQRYPAGVPDHIRKQLEHELALIDELKYAPYFLTVHDLVCFARSRGILCQGRGAAANSAVCFCLGVTSVDPDRIEVLFERFISRERNEPPDIDIDFEHERREEVIQYIYGKYGRDRAALTAEVISYRSRLAIREVGKVLGFSEDCIERLIAGRDEDHVVSEATLAEAGLNMRDPLAAALVLLVDDLMGFPRHLSQHVGGFVITQERLCDLVPIENAAMPDRTIIEWDKDDIDALGMIKVDCLGLGMLTCIRKCFELVGRQYGRDLTLATIPAEDPVVYDMICQADTVGVFQIESRAQMSMLPRLRPRCFYDLVIEVAIVRPGPIVGDMVHPYLRRRQGLEKVEYPNEQVREVLGKTLGVPLFQEQAMRLSMVAGGFTPDQADKLRRAIASKRGKERLEELGRLLVKGMLERGYSLDFASRCFQQFHGFSEYGFPESHAASFALLVYASCWLKRRYLAAFAAALLNSQPMGFYAPAQIVSDAQHHGVEVRAVDVNRSGWDCRLERRESGGGKRESGAGEPESGSRNLESGKKKETGHRDAENAERMQSERPFKAFSEASASPRPVLPFRIPDSGFPIPNFAIRLGLRMVKGVRQADALAIEQAVERDGPFGTIPWLQQASGVGKSCLRQLAAADAFRSMGLDRQAALWQIRCLRDEPMPLFDSGRESGIGKRESGKIKDNTCRRRDAESAERKPFQDLSKAFAFSESSAPLRQVLSFPIPDSGFPIPASESYQLPAVGEFQKVMQDYASLGLSLRKHPMAFLRPSLEKRRVATTQEVRDPARKPHGALARVAGVVLVRQRPSSASGVVFVTLEDETGSANLVIRPALATQFKKALAGSVLLASGKVERVGEVIHVLVSGLWDISAELGQLARQSRDYR